IVRLAAPRSARSDRKGFLFNRAQNAAHFGALAMSNTPMSSSPGNSFDWPLAYEAEELIGGWIEAFLLRNTFARKLAERMRDETGTDFFEWVDHLVMPSGQADALRAAGFVEERVEAREGTTVFWHPRAMMPRVLLIA